MNSRIYSTDTPGTSTSETAPSETAPSETCANELNVCQRVVAVPPTCSRRF
jgi:hypothetical protein